jgi:multisubunit Na+/H+ antiporter MnhE subunit
MVSSGLAGYCAFGGILISYSVPLIFGTIAAIACAGLLKDLFTTNDYLFDWPSAIGKAGKLITGIFCGAVIITLAVLYLLWPGK